MNIVITGTSSGIGETLARELLSQGHNVWGLARSSHPPELHGHARFTPISCDVAEWEQVLTAAAQIRQEADRLGAIITCAGAQGAIGPAMALDPEKWSRTVRVNLDGTFFAIRALHRYVSNAPLRAKVICFSGGGATKARKNFSAYGCAKAGVVRLVETLSEEWKDQPIDINAIAPGAINTRLTEEVLTLGPGVVGETEYNLAKEQKKTGGSSIQHVSGLVNFLLSQRSDHITGRLISAPWDPWNSLDRHEQILAKSDIYTLRRIVPEDRGVTFG